MATRGKKVEIYYTSQGTTTGVDSSALLFDGKNLAIITHGKTFKGTDTWEAATTSQEGYVPQLASGGGSIATQASEYVLTYKDGVDSTPTWKLLPTNAFLDTNDDTWIAADMNNAGYVPHSVKGKYLHANDSTGALEWIDDHTYTVNNNTFSIKSLVGSTTTTLSDFTANQGSDDDFTLVQGSNITFTVDATNRKLTIEGVGDSWRPVSGNGTSIGSNSLNIKPGTGISVSVSNGDITITNTSTSTDEATKQTANGENAERPILLKNGTGAGEVTNGTLFASGVTVNPSTNSLSISGNLSVSGTASFSNNVTGTRFISAWTSDTWLNGTSNATITSNHSGYSAILSMPVKNGRVSLSSYPASDNNIYLGYCESGRTTNSLTKSMYWTADTGNLTVDKINGGTPITSSNISSQNVSSVGGYAASSLVKFYLNPMSSGAPADSAKSWFTGTMPSSSGAIVYNVPGAEKTIIAGKSSGAHGHMLQLNYDDNYLRLLRYRSGSWQSSDWEKISAGYADSAGNADTVDSEHSSAFAHRQYWNDMVHSGNEYTWIRGGYSGGVWINYRTASGSCDGNITQYIFGNGKGGSLASITSGTFNGNCTGSAGSVSWSNVTGKPGPQTSYPAVYSVPLSSGQTKYLGIGNKYGLFLLEVGYSGCSRLWYSDHWGIYDIAGTNTMGVVLVKAGGGDVGVYNGSSASLTANVTFYGGAD